MPVCEIHIFQNGNVVHKEQFTNQQAASDYMADVRNAIESANRPVPLAVQDPRDPGNPDAKIIQWSNEWKEASGNFTYGKDRRSDISQLPYVSPLFGNPKDWFVKMFMTSDIDDTPPEES